MRHVKRALLLCLALVLALAAATASAATAAPAPVTGDDFHPLTPTRVLDTRSGLGAGQAGAVGPDSAVTIDLTGMIGDGGGPTGAVVLNVTVTDVTAPTYVSAVTTFSPGSPPPGTSNLNLVPGQTRANLVTIETLGNIVSFYNHAGSVDIIADLEGYYSGTAGAEFTPVTPVRVLDSRNTRSFAANATHTLSLAGHVPAGTTAVALNVTALDATANTFVTVWPDGSAKPAVSNINVGPGQTIPNQVIIGLGANSAIDIYNHVGTADVLIDIAGYYTDTTTSSFTHLGAEVATPPRVLDTRHAIGATGPVGANQQVTLDLRPYVPSTATAVVLTVTGTDVTAGTFVTVWPDGNARPVASSLNLVPGETDANHVTVALGADGRIDLYNHAGSIDLLADVAGYFAPPTTPCSAGCVSGWGIDVNGTIGDRMPPRIDVTPSPMYGLTDVTSIVDTHHSTGYALRSDGTVWTWGSEHTEHSAPTMVPGVAGATAIALTDAGGFFLKADGTVWSFGDVGNVTGQTGTAVAQVAGLSGVTAISGGPNDLYALTGAGQVMAIGQDNFGQLGYGGTCFCRAGPVLVSGLTNVTQIAGGYLDGFALRSDGTVWSWGYNASALFTGSGNAPSGTPLQVSGLDHVTSIAMGNSTNVDTDTLGTDEWGLALRSDGTVWSFGYDEDGELGNGTATGTPAWSLTPGPVRNLTGVQQIAAGANAGYAILSDGTAWAWGSDNDHELEDGGPGGSVPAPAKMADVIGASKIFGGSGTAFALFAK